MQDFRLAIEYLPPEALTPYENNTREHGDDDIPSLKKSIRKYGMDDPIGIWGEKNIIVEGHGRLIACQQLGMTEVPCIRLDHLTDEERREYAIIHNKQAELSRWDFSALDRELKDLPGLEDFNIDWGFPEVEVQDKPAVEDDYEPDPPKIPITKRGDVWKLGDHVLMCGDSTDPEDLRTLMAGQLCDLWLTDPPYNVNYQGTAGTIQNDNLEDRKFREFLRAAFSAATAVMKPGACFYIWHADSEGLNFRGACSDVGLRVRECLIWVKNSFVLGHSDYQWKHEPCLYGWKDGGAHYFVNSRSESTVLPDLREIDPKKLKKEELVQLLTEILSDKVPTTVIEADKPSRNGEHPTMKPIGIFDYLIRNSCQRGGVVLDSFAGSGTTIMACEQDGRRARCMELDEAYCDVIIDRWETFTGKKAMKLHGG